MNEREKGAIREKKAMEVLKRKNFTKIERQKSYDFGAWKEGQHYIVEVKGGEPKKNKNVPGLSFEQMKTLAEYRSKGSRALLMFVIHDKCSIFEMVDDITQAPEIQLT